MTKSAVEAQNLTRSCNEALILASLATGPKHGYQLAVDIERRGGGLFKFNHGTLYPILHKMEKDGLIRGTWSNERQKRKRKSYALTDKGRKYAREQAVSWREFYQRFFAILGAHDK